MTNPLDREKLAKLCELLASPHDGEVLTAARMASEYPAEFLGLGDELGRIAPGYRANLVLVDDDIKVHRTWIEGNASAPNPSA